MTETSITIINYHSNTSFIPLSSFAVLSHRTTILTSRQEAFYYYPAWIISFCSRVIWFIVCISSKQTRFPAHRIRPANLETFPCSKINRYWKYDFDILRQQRLQRFIGMCKVATAQTLWPVTCCALFWCSHPRHVFPCTICDSAGFAHDTPFNQPDSCHANYEFH